MIAAANNLFSSSNEDNETGMKQEVAEKTRKGNPVLVCRIGWEQPISSL
ncbi:MAG: hypothetical protein ACK6DX_14970 [Acidobacteriota bacterium]|jgi:hypothetical protein